MREMAITRSNSNASYYPIPNILLLAMFAGAFAFIVDRQALASDKLSQRIETSLTSLTEQFPNPTQSNLSGSKCQRSDRHRLEYFCGTALTCGIIFALLNDTRIFYVEHISGPEHCDEKSYFAQVASVVGRFFDMDLQAATHVTDELHRSAFIYFQSGRHPELTNKNTARNVRFGGGISTLTVSYESYPAEQVKRYRFRWDSE